MLCEFGAALHATKREETEEKGGAVKAMRGRVAEA